MTTRCFTPLLGKRIRVVALDSCGNVPASDTPDSVVTTDGFISVVLSSEVEDGAEIITRKASGALCVNEKQANSFKRFTVEMEFCGVDPGLLSLVSNAEVYENYNSEAAGIVVPEGLIDKRFALELWTGIAGGECEPGEEASGYLLLPFVNGGVLGDLTVDGENAVTFSMTGAYTKGGNSWGNGPFDVLNNGGAANEVQVVTITGTPNGGTFTLTFNGHTTGNIAYSASAANVQTALLAMTNLDTGDVVVTGGPGPGTPWTITFGGAYADEPVAQMTANGAGLTGGVAPAIAVTTSIEGTSGDPDTLPTALDPLDHLLLIETTVVPPSSVCGLTPMP